MNQDILYQPIAAIAGTNLIVGNAEPAATVYVDYEGNKYQGFIDGQLWWLNKWQEATEDFTGTF